MTVSFSACYAAVNKLSVVLEVDGEKFFPAIKASDLSDFIVHVFSLLRIKEQAGVCIDSHRHIVEIPGEYAAFVYEHIEEIIACHSQIVLTGVAYGYSKRDMVGMHEIHGCKGLLIVPAAAAPVIAFFKAFDAHGNKKVAYSQKVIAEFLVYEGTVGKSVESYIFVLFT